MKICFVSDLHCDHSQPPVEWPEADVLVIGGDTANTVGGVLKLVGKVAKRYRHVVIVDGNHEHYSNAPQGRTVEQTIEAIRVQLPENVHMLGHHQPRVLLDGPNGPVWFVGCNGWYSFDMAGDPIENRSIWKDFMNDNRWCGFETIEQTQPWDRAVEDAAMMQKALDEIADEGKDTPIICVTHTAPHRNMVEWTADPGWNRSNSFYVNSHMQRVLESDSGQRTTFWYNGHTHHRRERMIGKVYCLANPRGYPTENPSWEPVVLGVIM
jgi:Icc-related predicted phosphoesterase